MRLSRSFLLLAAGLAAAAQAADISVTTDTTISSTSQLASGSPVAPNNFLIGGNVILTVDIRNGLGSPIDTTFAGRFKDDGAGGSANSVIVKTGGGTLQYNGYSDITYFKNYSYLSFNPFEAPKDLRLDANNPVGQVAGAAFAGLIDIQQGQLQVSGFVNQWADYGAFNGDFNLAAGQMLGASGVIVGSGAKLSFQNTALNLVNAAADLGGATANRPSTPLVARLNFVNNLMAATTAEVEVGKTSDYILVAHADFAAAGLGAGTSTLGVLSGHGRFYKTGADAMTISGNATFDGEVVLAGGDVTLASANGDTLWLAKSVNLASSGAAQGSNTAFATDTTGGAGRWKPGYAPGSQANSLVVSGDQRIRNFQSLYGETGVYQPILPGTGGGTTVEIAAVTDILRVTQETGYDGYYTGSITGLGTFQKNGAGSLALLSVGNNIANIDIQAGKIISNVQSLGSGTINIGDNGSLSIVQNDSGALRALITSTSTLGELRFKPSDTINYRSSGTATTIGNADAGVADITRIQPNFYGKVIVENGNAIVFSAEASNAFANASGVELLTGPSARETSIRFNDTNQIVNNLKGDANTRIFLGRGNITLGVTTASTYLGGIEGVGNLVKGGSATFTLGGSNDYFGATIVQQGALAVTAANGVANTSGLILAGTATTFSGTGAQSIGALFGRAGNTVSAAGLTVGVGADLRVRLDAELLNLPATVPPVSAAYYLATETTDTVNGFSPVTTLTLLVQQYNLNDTVTVDGATDAAEALAYLDTVTVDGAVDAAEVQAHRGLLGFAGTLNLGSGGLTKVGVERLILSGTANYTGLTDVQEGILEVGATTLVGTSGVRVGEDGTFAIDLSSAGTFNASLTGSGVFQKLGAGRLDLDAATSAFTGTYDVVGGTLAVTFVPTVPGGSVTAQGSVGLAAGTTFIAKVATNLDWSGEVYGTGTFVKTGAGVLTLTTGTIYHTGLTDVQQGGLVISAMPAGDLALAAGTTFVADVADNPLTLLDDYFTHQITGTGQFTKTGLGDLRIENAQTFAGKVIVDNGSLTLVAANALGAASQIELKDGATLSLVNGNAQSLGNITATSGATVSVDTAGTDLTINAAAGPTTTFLGRILGSPDLIKTGPGKLYLDRASITPNAIATISIQAGELEGSQAGLGGADIDISAGAKLRFFADTGATEAYGITVTGSGAIAKSGAGTVDLTASDITSVDTAIEVAGGTLIVSEAALGTGVLRAPEVTLTGGSTFEYRATNSAAFSVANFSGTGNVTFGRTNADTPTITLSPNGSGGTGYTGLTTVRTGVTLVLGAGFTGLGGIATETGSFLNLSALSALTITQPTDETFAGTLVGSANLTFAGSATLTVTANGGTLNGYAGSVTVSGSTLALDLGNTKAINLANGGTLSLRGVASNYTGAITGSGNVVLEDGVDVNLLVGGNSASTSLGSAAVSRITLKGGSILTASFTTGSVLAGKSIQLDGGLLSATGTGAIAIVLAAPSATPGAANGDAGLELTGTGNYTVSGRVIGDLSVATATTATYLGAAKVGATPPADITGDVTVDGNLTFGQSGGANGAVTLAGDLDVSAAGTLSGGFAIAGKLTNAGTLAPGFSPLHVTVADIDNSGTLEMEITSTTEDQVAFSGSAILNRGGLGRLEVNRYGLGDSHGVRHVIFKDTASPGASSYVQAAAEDPRFATVVSVGTSTTALRHILVYPTQLQGGADGILGNADDAQDRLRSLAVDGEIAVYQVRARSEYVHSGASTHVLDWIKDITQVDMTETSPGEWTSTLGVGFTALGARFATLGDARLSQAIDNLSALGQYSLGTVAVSGAHADRDAIIRRLELRRFDMAGTAVKTSEWFVDAVGGRTTVDSGPTASIAGASAGVINQAGFDGYYGFNFGIDQSKGSNRLASVKTSGFRLGAFGGFLTDDRSFALDAGLSFAALSGDLSHPSAFDTVNSGSAKANTLSAWLRASTAVALDNTWSLTPFAELGTSSTKLSGLSESGQVDALTVSDATVTESSLSVGFGIQSSWTDGRGGWNYRLSLDVAYVSQFSGDTLSLTSGIPDEGLALSSSNSRILPGSGLSLAPTFTFGPDPDSTFTLGLRFDQASEGNAVTGQFGYRKKF